MLQQSQENFLIGYLLLVLLSIVHALIKRLKIYIVSITVYSSSTLNSHQVFLFLIIMSSFDLWLKNLVWYTPKEKMLKDCCNQANQYNTSPPVELRDTIYINEKIALLLVVEAESIVIIQASQGRAHNATYYSNWICMNSVVVYSILFIT